MNKPISNSGKFSLQWLLFCACFAALSCNRDVKPPITLSGLTMGTTYTVKINALNTHVDVVSLKRGIDKLLDEIDAKMSTYRPDSELSKINSSPSAVWIALSDDLYTVIEASISVSQLSKGAFDITAGPLINLWGFGPQGRPEKIPDDVAIQAAKNTTGHENIHLQKSSRSIMKEMDGIYIDLSAIAPGYAADKLAGLLEAASLHDYMVEIGGEIRARGRNPDGDYWRIGIEKPLSEQRSVERIINLKDTGMSTSGDYRDFYEVNGVRYSHTIDPGTGRPVTHNLASVTVLNSACMLADAWATALMVMGPDKGMATANQLGLPVYFILRNADGYSEMMSNNFMPLLHEQR
jgi:thiamine biosynthesis lipoprotein